MKRAVSAISLLAIVLALAWHYGLHEQLLARLRPSAAARVKPAASPATLRRPAPVEVRAASASFEHAIYYLPKATKPPRPAVEKLLPRFPSLRLATAKDDPAATVRVVERNLADYAPPPVDILEHSGHGLSKEQAEALQHCGEVFVLDFRYAPRDGLAVLRESQELLLALAEETGGLLWDEATREVFTTDVWKERRLGHWTGAVPDVPFHFTIHLYRNDDLLRAVTLGLGKFGLPDLVVEDLPASTAQSVGGLINLAAQTLFEKGRLDAPGKLHVEVDELKNENLRGSLSKSYQRGATGRADLTLVVGMKDEGDAANRLFEIDFPLSVHATRLEAQEALIANLFGATDGITRVAHDAELLEASRKAKENFPRLATIARNGFEPGQRLLLKAPFKTDSGGNEWMWVEVVTWKGDLVNGVLQNDPYEVPGLKAGARVEFRASDAFDYILYSRDGTSEGNTTGEILRVREGKPATGAKTEPAK